MGVITISRRMGSDGTYIGKKIANKLGLNFVDKQVISDIMEEYGFSRFQSIYDEKATFWSKFEDDRIQTMNFLVRTIEAIGACDNVVIVGRGGFGVFENFDKVLNVRTKANLDIRVQRKMEEYSISEKEAEKLIKEHDRIRKNFLESDCKLAATNTQDFDLVLDTGILGSDYSVEVICEAYKNLEKKGRSSNSDQLESLYVDSVLKEVAMQMIEKSNS